jgi:hypothetical protein
MLNNNRIEEFSMGIALEPGDIFLTRGCGFISKAIRYITRSIGEKRTKVNHVGIQYGPPKKDLVSVYRATNLTAGQVKDIVAEAEKHVGKKYGTYMIIAHFFDWLLLGIYFFRRMILGNKYPICSWVVADAFAKVGKGFGVKVGMATPDDIWDFIEKNSDKYKEIHPLKLLGRE